VNLGGSGKTEMVRKPPATILIVDDEEPIRRLVDRILQSAGYITRLAARSTSSCRISIRVTSWA